MNFESIDIFKLCLKIKSWILTTTIILNYEHKFRCFSTENATCFIIGNFIKNKYKYLIRAEDNKHSIKIKLKYFMQFICFVKNRYGPKFFQEINKLLCVYKPFYKTFKYSYLTIIRQRVL